MEEASPIVSMSLVIRKGNRFTHNIANIWGGGFFVSRIDGLDFVDNDLVEGNVGPRGGGGGYLVGCQGLLVRRTAGFKTNSAGVLGGGALQFASCSSIVVMKNLFDGNQLLAGSRGNGRDLTYVNCHIRPLTPTKLVTWLVKNNRGLPGGNVLVW